MASNVYKLIEIVGISDKSYDDAIRAGIAEASKTVRGIAWFEVVEMRGAVSNNKVTQFQAKLKIAFKIERE